MNPDYCPTCGRKISDFDMTGVETEWGQRFCIEHAPESVRAQFEKCGVCGEYGHRAKEHDN